ncbi:hypothetical protein CKAH01_09824 [Colletotrichum kahawae]|uniref:Uncharacterized protein n=1 Tax=Colletotrichum kahawae TaxID=34407 RepID=A0AAD9XZ24_COLKA|nr:hypothetical protein CKAH01_09824 [Colletotrichum kahawae]
MLRDVRSPSTVHPLLFNLAQTQWHLSKLFKLYKMPRGIPLRRAGGGYAQLCDLLDGASSRWMGPGRPPENLKNMGAPRRLSPPPQPAVPCRGVSGLTDLKRNWRQQAAPPPQGEPGQSDMTRCQGFFDRQGTPPRKGGRLDFSSARHLV